MVRKDCELCGTTHWKAGALFFHGGAVGGRRTFCARCAADYAGKWLVLFFYPMDFTFVCPTELTAFSEHRETFRAAGAELLSVSTDSVYTHQAWQRNGLGGLGYPMAADQTLRVCADYGVLLEEEGVALRGLFLIDPEQKVRYSVIHDNNIGRNPEEVLRVLAALKTGGLCAAGWKAGEENLRPDHIGTRGSGAGGYGTRAHLYDARLQLLPQRKGVFETGRDLL